MAYHRFHGLDTGIVRIFNTYGPRMRPDDGRAIPTFITQALRGEPITVHGTGEQTRSICYVEDLVRGIVALLDSQETGPINIGTENEVTMRELAEMIVSLTGSRPEIVFTERPADDPGAAPPGSHARAYPAGLRAVGAAGGGAAAHDRVLRDRGWPRTGPDPVGHAGCRCAARPGAGSRCFAGPPFHVDAPWLTG